MAHESSALGFMTPLRIMQSRNSAESARGAGARLPAMTRRISTPRRLTVIGKKRAMITHAVPAVFVLDRPFELRACSDRIARDRIHVGNVDMNHYRRTADLIWTEIAPLSVSPTSASITKARPMWNCA